MLLYPRFTAERSKAGRVHHSWFTGTTQQDLGNIIGQCTSTLGLKTISFGIGALHGG